MDDVQPIPIPEEPLPKRHVDEIRFSGEEILASDFSDVGGVLPADGPVLGTAAVSDDSVVASPVQEEAAEKKQEKKAVHSGRMAVKKFFKHVAVFLMLVILCAIFACGGYVLGSKKETVEKLMNIQLDGNALFEKIDQALSTGTATSHSIELTTEMMNQALQSSSESFRNLYIEVAEDQTIHIKGTLQTSVLQTQTSSLPEFLFQILPEQTEVDIVVAAGYSEGSCTIDILSAQMFGTAMDEQSIESLGLSEIAESYINEQIQANIPENVTLNSIRTENGKILLDLTF